VVVKRKVQGAGPPFFSVVTVAFRDAWAVVKTARSVFSQGFENFEYIVIDGHSQDGTDALIRFWQEAGLVDKALVEPDRGVYEAMNKGLSLAQGEFVCFMNAGDVFADDQVLQRVADFLSANAADGCLGWGQLNSQVWASWSESDAFKMASLGFCHQALFVRRDLLTRCPFDARPHKTDSDTLQLAKLYASGARIPIIPEVLAIRGGEPGISANLERTRASIIDTLLQEYPGLDSSDAQHIVTFRRSCGSVQEILRLLRSDGPVLSEHLARVVLDTLFLNASRTLSEQDVTALRDAAIEVLLGRLGGLAELELRRLKACQTRRRNWLQQRAEIESQLGRKVADFAAEETARIGALQPMLMQRGQVVHEDVVVALTSFPARIRSVQFVIKSVLAQTHRPAEIHLFLGKDELPGLHWLPEGLRLLQTEGLVIHFAERTCHQYDKFLHGAHLNKAHDYIIVDDDVIYPPNAIEALIAGRDRLPNHVVANRCHLIPTLSRGRIPPYSEWQRESSPGEASFRLLPTGAGGVLYPKGFFNAEFVCDVEQILATAPYADDLWLKACSLAQGIPTYATSLSSGSKWYHRYTPTMRAGTLMDINVGLGLNDLQFEQCCRRLELWGCDWRSMLGAHEVMEATS
jgi:hypothetical protein